MSMFLIAAVVLESDKDGVLGFGARAYEGLVGSVNLKPLDICLLGLLPLVLYHTHRAKRPLPLSGPLLAAWFALLVAVIAGVATGLANDASPSQMINPLRQLGYLAVVPLVVLAVVRDERDLRFMAKAVIVLAIIKGAAGIGASLLGEGPALEGFAPGPLSLSYYEPGSPWFLLLALMGLTASALVGVRLGWAGRFAAASSLGALLLSFRRSFWLGGIVGFLVLVLGTSGKRPRWRSAAVAGIAAATIVALSLSVGALPSSENVVLKRAQELAVLTGTDKSVGDQYRDVERRNVFENVKRQPLTGVGLGVPWTEYYRLPTVFRGGRDYVHVTALWYWLKLGLLGLITYLLFMLAALHAGWRVWRRARDPQLRAIGLGAVAAVLGLMSAEATASFTGVEARVSIIFGAMLGWLIAADAVASDREGVDVGAA